MFKRIATALSRTSLGFKLTIGSGTSLISVILVGIIGLYLLGAEFDRYLLENALNDFIKTVVNYYEQHQTWVGLDAKLRADQLAAQGFVVGSLPNLAPTNRPNNAPNGLPNPQQPLLEPPNFLLVDQRNVAQTNGGIYRIGDPINPKVIEAGTPVMLNNTRIATVLTLANALRHDPRQQEYLNRIESAVGFAAIGAILVALVAGALLTRILIRPINALTSAIRAMQRGELAQSVPVLSDDQIGELFRAFNHMSADLTRANNVRRQMTADIAHELRTPLTVLMGYLESLKDGALSPTPARFNTMYNEAKTLNRLVEDLRFLSLADAGELPLQRQFIQPKVLLETTYAAFHYRAEEKRISLILAVQASMPTLSLDRERILQVLGNLVSNALRYTPAGGSITLSASNNQERIKIQVVDTGSGIPPSALEHIFERFYRADMARAEGIGDGGSDGGENDLGARSGLGLAIAKAIIEAHGGSISATSTVGIGTTITINLPML